MNPLANITICVIKARPQAASASWHWNLGRWMDGSVWVQEAH